MKFVISESRLDSLIYDYISSNFKPDFAWQEPAWYKKEAKRWGYIIFDYELRPAFKYYYHDNPLIDKPKTLLVRDWLVKRLDELFGNKWEPIFVKWFEDNTGLDVVHLVDTGD